MSLPPCLHFRIADDGDGECMAGRTWPRDCHWSPFGPAVGCAQYQDSPMGFAPDEHTAVWVAEWRRHMGLD